MRIKITFLALCVPFLLYAQSKKQNYIKETLHLDTNGASIENVSYYNGLGDLSEIVSTASGTSDNVYTFKTYDSKGRESKNFYPTPIGSGLDFKDYYSFVSASSNYYNDEYAFKQNYYDDADHIVREDVAGNNWHAHSAHNECSYETNTLSDKVIRYDADPIAKSYYPEGCLEKESAKDADGNEVVIFKDLDGNTILERRNQGDTYYVYDKLGQLRYILSPQYQEKEDLAAYAYQYDYDECGNLVRKTLPGSQYTQYWYDKEGLLAYEQDALLRDKGLYRFYLYDRFDRVVLVGTTTSCNTNIKNAKHDVSFSSQNGGIANSGYAFYGNTSNFSKGSNVSLEKAYYYDSYGFLSGAFKDDFAPISPSQKGGCNDLLAGSIIKTSNGQFLFTVNSYDPKGNLINTSTKGLKGYTSKVSNTYSLTNKLVTSDAELDVKYGELLKISLTNEYSTRNNLLISKKLILSHGEGTESSSTLNYMYDATNRLSQIVRPEQYGNVSYSYDVHGWPVKIESNSFKEELSYSDGVGTPCYNGNISSLKWSNSNYSEKRGYKFHYDRLNRLTEANYGEGESLSNAGDNFKESVNYDLNGNITSLERHGKKQDGTYGVIDKLNVSLNGNQIVNISDAADKIVYEGALDFEPASDGISSCKYNDFGALISDTGRGITMIEYDNNKNPIRIQFSNGNVTKYIYSAEGTKLRTIYYTAMPNINVPDGCTHELDASEIQTTDSLDFLMEGNLILKNGRINKYLFEGGYCEAYNQDMCIAKPAPPFSWFEDGSDSEISEEEQKAYEERREEWSKAVEALNATDDFNFYYYNKDHLGNNREVIDFRGKICQVINYYPFGTPFSDQSTTLQADFQPYKYNGKEFDMMHGLNTYDYGARQYNPIVPTWDRIDPLCENFGYMSPYNYCLDNPVNTTDQDGEGPILGAVIGGGTELACQLIENYDTNSSVLDNLSKNVNWTNVGIAAGEGALTSGVSAFKGLGAKVAISAVTSAAKNVSDQIKDGAKSYKDIDYKDMAKDMALGAFVTRTSYKTAKRATSARFKAVTAKPTSKAVMHKRAGQMRYSKSTRRNARKRLENKKENYFGKLENSISAAFSSFISYQKRYWHVF
jgi:RHS repeat-associated protein